MSATTHQRFRAAASARSRSRHNGRVRRIGDWRAIPAQFTWWEIAVFFIGIVAALSVIGGLFFTVGNKPAHIYVSEPVGPVESAAFANTLSGLVRTPIERGGGIEILNNGDEFRAALLESLRSARHTINFSVYIWKSGTFSDEVIAALEERQAHGVAVRVLLDGFGAVGVPDRAFRRLLDLGGRLEKFRTPKFGQLTRFHRRNHRRAIVIDGEVGFTGGMAVSDVWLGHAQDPEHWRDMMFRVTGTMARRLQSAFADIWVSSSGEILAGPDAYPADAALPAGGVERFTALAYSPADDEQSMAYFFLLPMLAARQSIWLTTPYFIPDRHFMRVLVEKARAGVDVRLMLPGRHTDNWLERFSSQSRYDELLAAGVRIYEYQPTFIHSKYAVVDGKWSIVGSPNFNSRSRQLDEENAIGVLDEGLARRLRATFEDDEARTTRMSLAQWRARAAWRRILEETSRILDHQG